VTNLVAVLGPGQRAGVGGTVRSASRTVVRAGGYARPV